MAGRIKIEPYKPLDVYTPPVPGGGYIQIDASVGKFDPSPLAQLGMEIAQGLPSVAQAVSVQLARDDEAVVKDADTRLSEAEQALLFDPQTGYLNTQGKEAVEQAAQVLNTYRDAQTREAENLPHEAQRRMLEGLAQRRLATFSEQVERHSATERQRWFDTKSDRRIALMQADAGLYWSDDAILRRALGTVRAEVRDKADHHGWPSALTETALRAQTSRTLVSAIEAAVERDPERARSLRTRYDQHIEAHHRVALDALLTEAQTRQRAQHASAEILNAMPPDGQAPTLQWQHNRAETIADPAVRAATIRTLHAAAAATETRARTLAEQVLARVLKSGLTDPSQIPIRDWVALDTERRQAIESRLDYNAAGTEPAPNPALVDELATQMTQATADFARRDLVPPVAHLPLSQWQRFHDWQTGLRRNDSVTGEEVYAIKRGLKLTRNALAADAPDDVTADVRAELVEEINTSRRTTGKSPDDREIARMLLRFVPTALPVSPALKQSPGEHPPIHLTQSRVTPRKPGMPWPPERDRPRLEFSRDDDLLRRHLQPQILKIPLASGPSKAVGGRSSTSAAPPKSPSVAPLSGGGREKGTGETPVGGASRPASSNGKPNSRQRGHHIIPKEVYKPLGLSDEALKVFDRATTGPLIARSHLYDDPHRAYSRAVANEVDLWIKRKGITPGKMTDAEARELLEYVKRHRHPDIKDYLKHLDDNKQSLMRRLLEAGGLA